MPVAGLDGLVVANGAACPRIGNKSTKKAVSWVGLWNNQYYGVHWEHIEYIIIITLIYTVYVMNENVLFLRYSFDHKYAIQLHLRDLYVNNSYKNLSTVTIIRSLNY